MTEGAKTLVEILRKSEKLAVDCQLCPAYAVCPSGTISFDNTCVFVKAAEAIEHYAEVAEKASSEAALYETALQCAIKYQRELEQVRRERDAAVRDLSVHDHCAICKDYDCRINDSPCRECLDSKKAWKMWRWRGVCAENGGTSLDDKG